MKTTLLFVIALISFIILNAQEQQVSDCETNLNFKGFASLEKNPAVFIIVDTLRFRVMDFKNYDLKPKWVESVDVFKDNISKKVYGNKNGVMLIYTKKKYARKVMREIKNNQDA